MFLIFQMKTFYRLSCLLEGKNESNSDLNKATNKNGFINTATFNLETHYIYYRFSVKTDCYECYVLEFY